MDEEKYVTVRIPKVFDERIKEYIEAHREELEFQGVRLSRASIVKRALYEFLKKD